MNNRTRVSHMRMILLSLVIAVSLLLPAMAVGMDGGKININTATSEEMTSLPGIGLAKADAIVSYREEQGSFTNVEALLQVKGIGEKLVEKLRGLVTTN